jgi:hypothetical protein
MEGRTHMDDAAVAKLASIVQEPQVRLLYSDFQDLDERVPWRILVALAHLAKAERQRIAWPSIAALCECGLGMSGEFRDCGHALGLLKNSQIISEEQTGDTLSYYIRPDILRIWLRDRNYFFKEQLMKSSTSTLAGVNG